jgi:hypothetical protein
MRFGAQAPDPADRSDCGHPGSGPSASGESESEGEGENEKAAPPIEKAA